MKVLEFLRADQSSPYAEWFDSLATNAAVKISVAKARLEQGNTSSIKWFDGIGEYVIDWGPGYRIYLAADGNDLIILYGGGTKNAQQKDIDAAKQFHSEYKARKALVRSANKVSIKVDMKIGKKPRK